MQLLTLGREEIFLGALYPRHYSTQHDCETSGHQLTLEIGLEKAMPTPAFILKPCVHVCLWHLCVLEPMNEELPQWSGG